MMLSTILLAAACAGAAEPVDVQEYRITVLLQPDGIEVETTILVSGDLPDRWPLDLVPEMTVKAGSVTAKVGGSSRPVPFAVVDRGIVLDLSGSRGAYIVSIVCEGAPSERFSKDRGGFVRSAVRDDLLYVRSQVAWHPRVPDDPAVHHVAILGRDGWARRSAGDPAKEWFESGGPIDRAGLAAGPWKVVKDGDYDALVFAGRERQAAALLPVVRRAVDFHAADLGALPRKGYTLVEMPKEFGTGSGYSECGYILLGPGAFEAGPKADWVPGFLAHEAAHQWWGHDGLFSDFASEALAEYSAWRFLRASAGKDAAERKRRSVAERVSRANMGGKSAALSEIRGWGGTMDPETYEATAYGKSMLLLAAVEDAVGAEAMTALLRGFLGTARRTRVGWSDLRFALCAAGPEAKAAVETWEGRGFPSRGAPSPPPPGEAEAKAALDAGMKVANSHAEADPKILGKAIEDLRAARASPHLADGEKAAARTGIGRCLFRLGKLEEAEKELEEALEAGGGGPFHRGWIELHLGNIDDLRGKRKDALAHYRAVVDNAGASKTAVAKAKAFLEKPYRGFAQDG